MFIIKVIISAILIVLISEIAKRSSMIAAIVASLPLTSLLAIIWLYYGTHDAAKVAELSRGIFWMVLPSLAFFLVLPILLEKRISFYLSLLIAIGITTLIYLAMLAILKKFGVTL